MDNNSNISAEDAKALIKELRKATGSFGKFADSINSYGDKSADEWDKVLKSDRDIGRRDYDREKRDRKNQKEDRAHKIETSTRGVIDKFKMLEGSSTDVSSAFSGMTKVMFGGAVGLAVEGLMSWSTKLTSTYRDMTDIGQTFTGGLFDMSVAAAQSGMSLDKFAELTKKSSDVTALYNMSGKDFGKLTKSVREATYANGMFGYSIEGMNDLTTEYMKRQALQGRAGKLSDEQIRDGVKGLAEETTGLAKIFHKSREDITKDASNAMNNSAFMASMQQRTGSEFASANKAIQDGITQMAALPGESGKIFSEMMAETSVLGVATLSKHTDTFVRAGMGNIMGIMEQATRDMQSGTRDHDDIMAEFTTKITNEYQGNLEMLKYQALTGNESAKQVIQMMSSFKTITATQLKQARKDASVKDQYTNMMMNLDSKWGTLVGNIREKLIPVVQKLADVFAGAIKTFTDLGGVEALQSAFGGFSTWLQGFFGDAKDPSQGFIAGLVGMLKSMSDFPTFMSNFSVTGMLFNSSMLKVVGTLAAVTVGFYALKKGMAILGEGIAGKFLGGLGITNTKDMTVNAKTVIVNGAVSKGFDGLTGGANKQHDPNKPHDPNHKPGKWDRFKNFGKGAGGKLGGLFAAVTAMSELGDVAGVASDAIGSLGGKKGDIPTETTSEAAKAKVPGAAEEVNPKAPKTAAALGEASSATKAAGEVAEESGKLGFLKRAGAMLGRVSGVMGKVQLALGAYHAVGGIADFLQGKKSLGEVMQGAVQEALPGVMSTIGGAVGGIVGGAAGTALLPGVGTAAGGVAGAVGGSVFGEFAANKILSWVFGPKADASTIKPATPVAPPSQPPAEQALADAKKALADAMSTGQTAPADLLKKMDELTKSVKEQTEVLAKQNNTLIKQGGKALYDSFKP